MLFRNLMSILLIVCASSMAFGQGAAKQGQAKGGKGKRAGAPSFIAQLEKKITAAEPTDEQKAKLKALSDEYSPKLAELTKKYDEGMPEDVRKQLASGRKELAAAGTKGKELASGLAGKVKLTDEQKKLFDETNMAKEKLQREILVKVTEILTPEQVAKTGIKTPKKRKADKKNVN